MAQWLNGSMMESKGVKALNREGVRCKGVGLPDLRK